MGNKALVIGGAGFLGSGIVQQLLHQGWEVCSLGRGKKQNMLTDVEFLQVDRKAEGALKEATQHRTFDLVVDCAAYQDEDVRVAADVFMDRIGHYVFISTDYVYASSMYTSYPITEEAATQRDTSYAIGKLNGEAELKSLWNTRKFPGTALRPPHIMGAGKELGCDLAQGRNKALLQTITSRELKLVDEGQFLIQPVWNKEVGSCIAHIAGNPGSFGEVFNCMGPDCVTALGYYQMVADYLGVPLHWTSVSRRTLLEQNPAVIHYVRHRCYDLTKLQERTGYKPQWRLKDAIAETIEWMKQQG